MKLSRSDYNKQYYEKNKELIKARSKQWAKDNVIKHNENFKKWARSWRDKNREKIRLLDKEFYVENKEKKKFYKHRRRAILRGLSENYSIQDIKDLWKEQNGLCYYCGVNLKDDRHIEHKTPISRGGSNTKENLALSCPLCDWRKNNKTEQEFRVWLLE